MAFGDAFGFWVEGSENSCLFCIDTSHSEFSGAILKLTTMPRFRITTKRRSQTNGVRIEPGMSVEVVSNSFSNPLTTNGGQVVADAFMRIYGIDIRKAGIMSQVYLDVESIG